MKMRNIGIRRVLTRKISTTRRVEFERKKIETVCPRLHNYLFPHVPTPSTSSRVNYPGHLPTLTATDITEHFRIISERQTSDHRKLLDLAANGIDLRKAKRALKRLDDGDLWRLEIGWTRYPFDSKCTIGAIEKPMDDVLFFDVEVCVTDGNLPTLAIALGHDSWYGWCSERLVNGSEIPKSPGKQHLIPIGDTGRAKVIIGHNVGYDRARCCEAYEKTPNLIRFMDTMSMSIPMFGMADHQQSLYEMYDVEDMDGNTEWVNTWKGRVSRNSLVAVHDHLYPHKTINAESFSKKTLRASFVKDPIEQIRQDFQPLMSYCARDNILCAEIYLKLWPEFLARFPHPATLAGMLNMGNAYLPINKYWPMFYEKNVRLCEEKKTTAAQRIVEAAKELAEENSNENPENDLWLWAQNWNFNSKYEQFEWLQKLFKVRSFSSLPNEKIDSHHIALKSQLIPAIFGFCYGPYPLFKTRAKGWGFLVPDAQIKKKMSMESFVEAATDLKKEPVMRKFPLRKLCEVVENNEYMFGELPISPDRRGFHLDTAGLVQFYQLEHPSGDGNVGDPLTKHFAKDLEEEVLRPTRYEHLFADVLDSIQTTQFWTSYSERYRAEVTIWENEGRSNGAIAAAVVPAGTVSRRSVHKLWVTLTNQKSNQVIGTGIKAMVQAPEGYRLVGADVDSQEQWLAALYGDASAEKSLPLENRRAGRTAFSNMMLAGSKSDNTDLHSVVASQLKISRNHAKTLNYARLYGSGETHAGKHLMRVGGMKQAEAEATAAQLFRLTKGHVSQFFKLDPKFNVLVEEYCRSVIGDVDESKILAIDGIYYFPAYNSPFAQTTIDFESWLVNNYSMNLHTKDVDRIAMSIYEDFGSTRKLFVGGYESSTFNFLEMSASNNDLRTPILGCQIADSLGRLPDGTPDSKHFDKKYKRSVMNWIVQSSAVDFLHLLLVSMQWLCETYSIDARFVISIHDEVRYMCREADAPRLALALQLSNLLVRAFISQKVGICQLPNSIAFFSQVDCDTVLRKEVDTESINPDGTRIENGIAWTIDDVLNLTNGELKKENKIEI